MLALIACQFVAMFCLWSIVTLQKLVNLSIVVKIIQWNRTTKTLFLCRLWSITAHRDHFVRRLSVRPSVRPSVCLSVCLSGSHTFLVVTHSYVLQSTQLPLCLQRGIYGFYSKTAPFIDFILYFRFLRFYKVKYLNFYEWVLKISWHSQWRHSDVTKWAILHNL